VRHVFPCGTLALGFVDTLKAAGAGSDRTDGPLLKLVLRRAPDRQLPASGALLLYLEEAQLLRRVRHQQTLGLLVVQRHSRTPKAPPA
jgi:hypothetical protein